MPVWSTKRVVTPRSIGHRMEPDGHGQPMSPVCGITTEGLFFRMQLEWDQAVDAALSGVRGETDLRSEVARLILRRPKGARACGWRGQVRRALILRGMLVEQRGFAGVQAPGALAGR